jgi:hypothetical protein
MLHGGVQAMPQKEGLEATVSCSVVVQAVTRVYSCLTTSCLCACV